MVSCASDFLPSPRDRFDVGAPRLKDIQGESAEKLKGYEGNGAKFREMQQRRESKEKISANSYGL